jgi:molecular chaperone DnaJ
MSGAPERDYYEVLGVPHDADERQIKDAYHRLAMRYHPDRNKAQDAEARFKEIAKAYAVLRDPNKRARYDAGGHAGVAHFTNEDLFGDLDLGDMFGGLDLGGGLFGRIFGNARSRGPRPGTDVVVELVIPLERVLHGGEEVVRYHRAVECPACAGSGAKAGTRPRPCEPCHGSGRRVATQQHGGVTWQQVSACPDCGGKGQIVDEPCPQCIGRGRAEREEAVKIRIPPGLEEGSTLRVPAHGLASEDPDGVPGDLLIVVRTRPDARFERRGADLWHGASISAADAALGIRLEVPTLEGAATVKVPAGTQPHSLLRLRGKGLPRSGGAGRGELNVRVLVEIPRHLDERQRALYEQLRRLEAG